MDASILFQGQGRYKTKYVNEIIKEASVEKIWQSATEILGWSALEKVKDCEDVSVYSTDIVQPLIFLMEYSQYVHYKELLPQTHIMMGHSLGEFTALVAANMLSYEEGLDLVRLRGELMANCATDIEQGMLALLDCDLYLAEKICEDTRANTAEMIWVSNYNSEKQYVLSGTKRAMDYVVENFDVRFHSLRVQKAFHTVFMKDAATKFYEKLKKTNFKLSDIGVVSNYTAKPYQFEWSIPEILYKQMISPVRWQDSMEFLREEGIVSYVITNDYSPFPGMYRDWSDCYQWITMKEFENQRIIDYAKLYHSHEIKMNFGKELLAECLNTLISDSWNGNATEEKVTKAQKIYDYVRNIYLGKENCSKEKLKDLLEKVEKVLQLKGIEEYEAISRIDTMLCKYGVNRYDEK